MLKRLTFLSVLVLVVLVWGWPAMAAGPEADQAENIVPAQGTKAPGDILWHCDVQTAVADNQILGIETLRDTVYMTGGNSGLDPNKIYVWTRSGGSCNYQYTVDQASLAGWGWRDIACDGQYLYASDNYVLAAFTVSPAGVIVNGPASITVNSAQMPTLNPVRAVAYDEDNDWFWAANFGNPIYAFDRSGNMMATAPNIAGPAYGMAYDNTTPGGPYLWLHIQDSTNVYQFHIPSLSFTGTIYSGWGDDDPGVSGIAGGLCVLEGDPSKDKASVTLLGVTQCSPVDEMYAMEIYVHEDSLYWKPPYENYAPSGMPDIDMWQGYGWFKTETGRPTFDGPCAVANCFKWFDSKYEEGWGGVPGDADDRFPLVRDYLDNLPTYLQAPDDHSPENIDIDWWTGPMTPWMQGATTPPPPTTQPFVPGYQFPPQPMPPWGELVERLAWYLDLDGVQSGYCNHSGTRPQDMHDGIQDWLESETFAGAGGEQQFIRGDVDEDGDVDVQDIAACSMGGPFACDDAADVNDDGVINLPDCDYLIEFLYNQGPPPPPPYPDCGVDPTADGLSCASCQHCPSGPTLADTLCVNIWPMPTFELVETLVEKCEDMILLLGFWWQDPTGQWWRNGGHWVTVAGINSEDFLIAFSDPFIDNAEYGGRGRVGSGTVLPHDHGIYDHWTHNDEGNVSHDVYEVTDNPISPGGLWEIVDYGVPYVWPSWIASRFEYSNVPPEFEPMTMEYDTTRILVTEVEYAIQVSPWDYRGDVNIVPGGDGVVNVADVVFLVNYLYKGGDAPDPYWEGDVTCDGVINVADVVYLVNYLYKGGPVPRCCDP
ncbi:MAG: dockerin type I repeat-containing protein [Candidatus Zixiibacteriota bacterium]